MTESAKELERRLFLGYDLSEFPLPQDPRDSPNVSLDGWWWFENYRKDYDENKLLKIVLGIPAYCVFMSGRPVFNRDALGLWMDDYQRYMQLTAMLIIFARGGYPTRGTELSTMQYRNDPGARRHLYVEALRRLRHTLRYNKTSSLKNGKCCHLSLTCVAHILQVLMSPWTASWIPTCRNC